MEMNGGFLVTKIKQLGDRIFEKILSEKNIDAFNGSIRFIRNINTFVAYNS